MSDGSGTGSGVTTYAYHPVGGGLGGGQASSINGSLSSDVISFTYDELGRVATRTLNGNAVGFSYDNLGRRIEWTIRWHVRHCLRGRGPADFTSLSMRSV